MLRSATTNILRRQAPTASLCFRELPRRTLFTSAKPTIGHRARSFVVRLGLLGGVIYLYNTSSLFAVDSEDKRPHLSAAPPVKLVEKEKLDTVDELHARAKAKIAAAKQSINEATDAAKEKAHELIEGEDREKKTDTQKLMSQSLSPEEIEEEAGQQGAFNEETGEINWDCPCLGGMAHGPCGTEFREAFSCFVFSKEDPKGMDCIENFKAMQDCFRKYPEVYGEPESEEDIEKDIDDKLEHIDVTHDRHAIIDETKELKGDVAAKLASHDHDKSPSDEPKNSSLGKTAPVDKSETSDLGHPAPGSKGISDLGHAAPGTTSGSGLSHPSPGSTGTGTGGNQRPPPASPSPPSGISR